MAEDDGDTLGGAEVGQPVPGEQALDANHQVVAEGGDGGEESIGPGGQVALEDGAAVGVEDGWAAVMITQYSAASIIRYWSTRPVIIC